MTEPSRITFWNIQYGQIIYVIAAVAVAVLVYVLIGRYKMWHLGKPEPRITGSLAKRWQVFLKTTLIDFVFHRKFLGVADNLGHRPLRLTDLLPKELYPGVMHFLIFAGIALLFLGTAMDTLSDHFYDFLVGNFYLSFSLFTDIGGILALIGVIMAFFRRYVQKPQRLDNKTEDLMALLAVFLLVVTGFIVEGLRMAANEIAIHPSWSYWSPGGYLLAKLFVNVDVNTLLVVHRAMWWLHAVLVFGFMVYGALYFNRLWHILVSPLNVFFRNLGPRGEMVPIDMEKSESFGVSKIQDFSWKNLLDLDACTRCGRCSDVCPAHLSGKPLNPKSIVQNLKTEWLERAPEILSARSKKGQKTAEGISNTGSEAGLADTAKAMIGGVIDTDSIWNCTSCYACQEVCPVTIEPMFKITEMRRNLVLEQASIPETAEGALRSIEDRGHPWRGTLLERTTWFEGMDIKPLSEDNNVEILYWVGCTEALEDRSLKVAQATAGLLKQAGVKFGVLGCEESCCGDPARRLGNEYLYQMQAQKNIETLKGYNIKKIVTGCAHCFNTLKNEYPQFGGNYEVIHHSQFLLQLLKEGKLKVSSGHVGKVTYHDACYLGRYNNIFEAPRQLLSLVPGLELTEMTRNRERNFCCGAGGGHLWLEEQKVGERINVMRTDQATAVQAETIATACPYCLQMFQDGIKTKGVEESLKVKDISELLAEACLQGKS
jgi:Fe-S oxidoreductase/nitrate reductase gamma subunit